MSLKPGIKLGPYEVLSPLGAGGMGEVYRARDTKLGREVALKVLPEMFTGDAQRMARFEREAKVLASLNHPNIAAIYGLDESGNTSALVMELVEGLTLGERVKQGPVPLDEVVHIAKQIAEALEYAHERGIIHRDLKPANIKLKRDGQVKVLDFGLAKALDGETGKENISTSPTLSAAATRAGVLLGTAAYMSPEQAKGNRVDERTDIWAFGCVVYEILSRKPAFDGETITDTLAAVVRAEPEWTNLPDGTPRHIRELLERCLTKDAKQRLQAIGEARIALEKRLEDPSRESLSTRHAQASALNRLAVAFGTVGILVGIAFAALYLARDPQTPRVVRSYIKAMANAPFFLTGQQAAGFAVSPDGQRLAYVARSAEGKSLLWVRQLNSLQAQPLAGTEDAGFPFWSPDSRSIGFFAEGKLKKIEAAGGPPLVLSDAPTPRGGTWNQEGVILFAPSVNVPLHRVSSVGGTAIPVTSLDSSRGETTHRWPSFLPDGKHFLYVAGTPVGARETSANTVLLGSLDSMESRVLLQSHASAVYASGHILFLRQNTLMAQPFDVKRLALLGEAAPIVDSVQEEETTLRSIFSISQNGVLAYLEGASIGNRELLWMDRSGKKVGAVPGTDAYTYARISPDGKKLVYVTTAPIYDIWAYDNSQGVKTRLTFASASGQADLAPVWSSDGQRITYLSLRNGKYGLYRKSPDGSGSEELLLEGTEVKYPNDSSPDGRFLAFQQSVRGRYQVWMLPLSGEHKSYPFRESQVTSFVSAFSPDGKWLAYCSSESGEQQVYVELFPGPGGKWQISSAGGCYPRWRRDGKELFYLSTDNKMMAAEIKTHGSSFARGPVTPLFEAQLYRTQASAYDVSPDGQRFLVVYDPGQPNATITLVQNWDVELKRK